MIREFLAQSIRKHRIDREMSQDDLAGKAGISTRYLQEIEAAEKQPSITTLFKIAKAFDIHYSELLNGCWREWLEHPDSDC